MFVFFGLWLSLIYALWIVFKGNPVYKQIKAENDNFLESVDSFFEEDNKADISPAELTFLKHLALHSLVSIGSIILELMIAIYLTQIDLHWLGTSLLFKILISLVITYLLSKHIKGDGMLLLVKKMVVWPHIVERISFMITVIVMIFSIYHIYFSQAIVVSN